ncbi:Asp-tRNA(Asn)/Glu-tRNA(Gln) amidotransferase subunit GatA [Microbacterium pseudoresistens]|uniref:Aspartyl-tRNA(Asn)/glutamyl-tRNA(Gln) amidotransferase subunit A n=1 Tax=Microbacterium pseudoresistens TaxID=640634 RepID=A0A7Y9ETV1_9MICO|nr:amidase [Microbacterium pseudoresistens]NYD53847.1 aspartyl-tRNA(Asn)/glutamyl-tRNA(Gln) amidotransferase subunit A [Microbacterium pseudoresistens]
MKTDKDVREDADISRVADRLPLTISAAARALRDGTITSRELTEKTIARADALAERLGVYIVRLDDEARQAADRADEQFARGVEIGPLQGIPLGIKDNISTSDAPTTAQSLVLESGFGGGQDAPVVARLRAAGAVLTGKTTTMEFAVGMPDPQKPFPIPRNPFSTDHWTGGSSSGTGAGVASGLFLGGLGTDTGGSIRMPAAWCGISGFKQTFGRVPKSRIVPLGFSYDHVGPMTRTAYDCGLMLNVLAGHDESDACSVDRPVDDYVAGLDGNIEGLRVGIDLSFLDSPLCDPATAEGVHAAIAVLREAGVVISDAPLPYRDELKDATMLGFVMEAFAYHRENLKSRWEDYGAETRLSIATGALFSSGDYVQMQRLRRAAVREMEEMFAHIDIHLTPTAMTGGLPLATQDFEQYIDVVNTGYWNGVGYPAISVPMGQDATGLPLGLQLAGRPFEESTVLRIADAFQRRTSHHLAESDIVKESIA